MKSFLVKGEWWLPENPDKKIGGELSFSQDDGGRLLLLGVFEEDWEASPFHSVLIGIDENNDLYSLEKCTRNNTVYGRFSSCSYRIYRIFRGIHVNSTEDLLFKKFSIEFSYLFDWLDNSGLTLERSIKDYRSSFTYVVPDDLEVYRNDEVRIELTFEGKSSEALAGYNFVESVSVFGEVCEFIDFDTTLQKYVMPIIQLLDLATDKRNFVESLTFIVTEGDPALVSCFYQQIEYEQRSQEKLTHNRMLLPFAKIREINPRVFENWFDVANNMPVITRLFFRERHSPRMFLELRLLTITQALEKYHRHKHENDLVPMSLRKSVRRKFVKSIPKAQRDWVIKGLQYAGQKSLKDRLSELVGNRQEILLPIVGNLDQFARAATSNRNYYTHFGEELETKRFKDHEFLFLVETLSILLESCLLNEIGMDTGTQHELFRAYPKYRWLETNSQTLKDAMQREWPL